MRRPKVNERCRYDTWVRRTRLLSWMLGTLYEIGLVHGFGWHSGGGRMHICGHPFTGVRWGIPGKGPYLLWWPRQKWECLVKRHHWPYWPEGRPVFMGLCGKCARCSECGSIEQECYPWCSNVQPSEVAR